jgi:hypothetical protein
LRVLYRVVPGYVLHGLDKEVVVGHGLRLQLRLVVSDVNVLLVHVVCCLGARVPAVRRPAARMPADRQLWRNLVSLLSYNLSAGTQCLVVAMDAILLHVVDRRETRSTFDFSVLFARV